MTRPERAIQQATLAVAVFDAGWSVPDMQLLEDLSDEISPVRATIGKALADLDSVPVDARPSEAATGLRMLVAFILAPGILGGAPNTDLSDEAREYGLYIASYVPGVPPAETLGETLDVVRTWLEAPTVQSVIRGVAEELEQRGAMLGSELAQSMYRRLHELGIQHQQ